MQGKYQQWSDDTNSSIATTMAGLGMQNDQLADEDALMRRLEQMGNTAEGRMQAWQVRPSRKICCANCLHWVGITSTLPATLCSRLLPCWTTTAFFRFGSARHCRLGLPATVVLILHR